LLRCAALSILAITTVLAQTSEFEAATVKPADPAHTGRGINVQPGRIKVINSTLKLCIQYAWNVMDFQVSGGPGWAGTEAFDIDAVAAKRFESGEPRAMLQTLLAQRFGLVVHKETQEKKGFVLVVGKNGPKLQVPEDNTSVQFSRTPTGDMTLTARNVTMAGLASALSLQVGSVVVDQTGLEGHFSVFLQWTPDTPLRTKSGLPIPPPPDAVPGPTLFTALQEKLGLKLEAKKVPTEVIVIDRAKRPTAN
jgi:uncharacterized protein (TIGR03435 family)